MITIHDRSSIHNFHLTGPGVNKKTSVARRRHDEVDGEAEEGHLQASSATRTRTIMHGVLKVT